jgi:hypothetical protein
VIHQHSISPNFTNNGGTQPSSTKNQQTNGVPLILPNGKRFVKNVASVTQQQYYPPATQQEVMPGYSALQLGPSAQKMVRKRTIDSRDEARNTNRESIEVVRVSRGANADSVV